MKKITIFLFLFLLFPVSLAQAFYVIDGNVDDWGIDLSQATNQGYLDTHLPTGGYNIDVLTEDNADVNSPNNTYVGPGYTTGNTYDAEAIYFDNDADYLYIAVITGLPATGTSYPAGDIFIEIGSIDNPFLSYAPGAQSYAIDVTSSTLYSVSSWDNVQYSQHSSADPWRIARDASGDVTGDNVAVTDLGADFVYSGEQNSHYVMEARIPLALLDMDLYDSEDSVAWIHWTMKCGNDELNLKAYGNHVPEPATLFLLGGSLLGGAVLRRRKKFE